MLKDKNSHNVSNTKLVDINKQLSSGIILPRYGIKIDDLIKVNYFRTFIEILIKKIMYTLLSKKYYIYENKQKRWDKQLSNDYIIDLMEKLHFHAMSEFVKDLINILNNKINIIKI